MGLSVVKTVYFFLGIFEFLMVYRLIFVDSFEDFQKEISLIPLELCVIPAGRYFIICFTFFLGLLRISWAVSENGLGSWFCGLLIHIAETLLMWSLALLPHYNKESLPLDQLFLAVVNQTVGDTKSRFILFFVPFLALILLARGPTMKTTVSNKKD